jgi:hypothetical protein
MIETSQFQLLLATVAGWVSRHQASVIAYLIEENRVLKEQLTSGGTRVPFHLFHPLRITTFDPVASVWETIRVTRDGANLVAIAGVGRRKREPRSVQSGPMHRSETRAGKVEEKLRRARPLA